MILTPKLVSLLFECLSDSAGDFEMFGRLVRERFPSPDGPDLTAAALVKLLMDEVDADIPLPDREAGYMIIALLSCAGVMDGIEEVANASLS